MIHSGAYCPHADHADHCGCAGSNWLGVLRDLLFLRRVEQRKGIVDSEDREHPDSYRGARPLCTAVARKIGPSSYSSRTASFGTIYYKHIVEAVGFSLQGSKGLGFPMTNVTTSPVVIGTNNTVLLPASETAGCFDWSILPS